MRCTIDLAHELGMESVAEGIEDEQTLDFLRKLGRDYGQGYFISEPVFADRLMELAASQRLRPSAAA